LLYCAKVMWQNVTILSLTSVLQEREPDCFVENYSRRWRWIFTW